MVFMFYFSCCSWVAILQNGRYRKLSTIGVGKRLSFPTAWQWKYSGKIPVQTYCLHTNTKSWIISIRPDAGNANWGFTTGKGCNTKSTAWKRMSGLFMSFSPSIIPLSRSARKLTNLTFRFSMIPWASWKGKTIFPLAHNIKRSSWIRQTA